MQKKAISMPPLNSLTGDKIIVTLAYLGTVSPSHRGWIHIVLILTLFLPIVVHELVKRVKIS